VEDKISVFEDKIEIKEKTKTLNPTTQELWKEYARNQKFYQKNKLENHGYQRRRGASQRDMQYSIK
jgi:hypothetical protein